MNKKDIIQRLNNTRLDPHERESLSQLLHYLHAEGLNNTSGNNNTHYAKNTKKKTKPTAGTSSK